jgi:hypothetical protein
MTVATTTYSALTYSGNDATTAFAVTWPFLTGSLIVTAIDADGVETVKTITTHYTVSGGGTTTPATGTVTMLTAPATGTTLRIERATPQTQATAWGAFDAFPQSTVEFSFDKLTLMVQERATKAELDAVGDLSLEIGTVTTGAAGSSASATLTGEAPDYTLNLTIPRGATGASGAGSGDVVGPASATADAIALFDGGTGKIIKNSTYTITAAGAALLDDASASDQRTTLGLSALATASSIGTSDIAADAVTYAKIQDVTATSRVLGRVSSGAGIVEEVTGTQVLDFISATQGDILYRNASAWVALPAGTSGQFLKTNGAGANPAWETQAGGQSDTRLGSEASTSSFASSTKYVAATGNVMTGVTVGTVAGGEGPITTIYYRPLQKNLGAGFVTVSQL